MTGVGCLHQRGLHRRVDRVADDAVGVDILDGAQVELAFIGAVFGDVGQPDLVGDLGAELPLHEIVVDWWLGAAVQFTFLAKIDQMRS
ncbi:hypothetical protein GCM10009856_53750 [Mycolicibacterium llatzerense]